MNQQPMPPPPEDERVDRSAAHAEASALGAVLLGGDVTVARQTLPDPDDPHGWTIEGHWTLWQAILDVTDRGDRPDMPAVVQRLMDDRRLDRVGGAAAVADLVGAAPAPSTLPSWAATVADRAHRRRMTAAAQRVIAACGDLTRDPASAVVELDAILDDTPTQGGLRLIGGDQLDRIPDPEWLVEDRITRGLTVVWGQPKSGKSFVALDLAAARACGNRWHGMTIRPGRTIYAAAEGLHDAKARLQVALDRMAAPSEKRAKVAVTDTPLDLTSSRDLALLDAAVDDHAADLLVLDTWARVSGVEDENDAAQAGKVVGALDRIRHRHECDVIVVHHARKDGMTMRGSTALLAALDTAVKVTKDGDLVTADASDIRGGPEWSRKLEWRLRPAGQAAVLELPSDRISDGEADDAVAQVMHALRSGPVPDERVIREHSRSVLARVKQDPHVDVDRDDRGRPILVRRTPL